MALSVRGTLGFGAKAVEYYVRPSRSRPDRSPITAELLRELLELPRESGIIGVQAFLDKPTRREHVSAPNHHVASSAMVELDGRRHGGYGWSPWGGAVPHKMAFNRATA